MLSRISQADLILRAGSPTHVEALAKAMGSGWQGGYVNPAQLSTLLRGRPFIAQMFEFGQKLSHFIVVDGMDSGLIKIRDPANGGSMYRMTVDEFLKFWTTYGVFPK
jgi:hypothetical protein